jgi:hypothetical protein
MRTRTLLAACGLAAAVLAGTTGAAAAAGGPVTANGNGSVESFGNTVTGGTDSPELGLINGSLNKPCLAVPVHLDLGSLAAATTVVQDINVLDSPQTQQCTENSSEAQGDEPLSHILSGDPILSGNG